MCSFKALDPRFLQGFPSVKASIRVPVVLQGSITVYEEFHS